MGSVWHLICLSVSLPEMFVYAYMHSQWHSDIGMCLGMHTCITNIISSVYFHVWICNRDLISPNCAYVAAKLESYSSCDLINFWWFLDPLNREVVVEIAQRPIFSKGSSSVYISMKPSFHLQLKSGSPLPSYPEAVTSSTDEAFKEWLWPTSHILGCSVILHASLVVMLKIFCTV